MDDADVIGMKMAIGHLGIDIKYSRDNKRRLELQCKQKQIQDWLEAMRKNDKLFLQEVELVPHQMQVNFPERCVVNDLLRSKMQ